MTLATENKVQHLVSLADYDADGIWHFLELGKQMKHDQKSGNTKKIFEGKTLGMIFLKPSLRTRVSFEVGMTQLGGHAIYLGPDDIKLGQRETTEDIAKVMSGYVDGIMARVFGHDIMEDLAKHATVPVINGLSDLLHPCQILADLLTVWEHKDQLEGRKAVFVGDGNNVAHSWLNAAPKLGMHFTLACPEGHDPNPDILNYAKQFGTTVEVSHNPHAAVEDADVIYTDVWASMGQEAEAEAKKKAFLPFQVNAELVSKAKPDCIIMHCLPAHYDEEITYDVAQSANSVIYGQAENRLHAQKAVMATLMGQH